MRRLGSQYVLRERLGRGASGEVWRASHEAGGDDVAVKILRAELAEDADVVDRFLRERRLLLGFTHPHLVRVRDLVAEGDTLAIVMDLVDGTDLRGYLRRHGPLDAPAAVALVGQVLDALAAVHAQGVVHRDVKPENILVDTADPARPRALLTDFGIARLTQVPSTTRSGLIGTPRYMAPELSEGARATAAADLYSVGIVLYELVSGRPPFDADHPMAMLRAHLEQRPVPLDGLPGTLWPTLARLLAKTPAQRPPTALEAHAALTAALAADPLAAASFETPGTLQAALDGGACEGGDGGETVLSPTPGPSAPAAVAASPTAAASGDPGQTVVSSPPNPPTPVTTATPPARAAAADASAETVMSSPPGPATPSLVDVTSETALSPLTGAARLTPTPVPRAALTAASDNASTGAAAPRSRRRVRPAWLAAGAVAVASALVAGSLGLAAAVGGGPDTPTARAAATASAGVATRPPGSSSTPSSATPSGATPSGAMPASSASAPPTLPPATGASAGIGGGAAPRTSGPAQPAGDAAVAVPDTRGLTLDQAATTLKNAGFDNIPYVRDCYAATAGGLVVRQDPGAGAHAARTTPVHLFVQADNCATVPDVRGLTLGDAAAALKRQGLANIPYVYECLGSASIGAVVRQSPAPGTSQVDTLPVHLELQADNC